MRKTSWQSKLCAFIKSCLHFHVSLWPTQPMVARNSRFRHNFDVKTGYCFICIQALPRLPSHRAQTSFEPRQRSRIKKVVAFIWEYSFFSICSLFLAMLRIHFMRREWHPLSFLSELSALKSKLEISLSFIIWKSFCCLRLSRSFCIFFCVSNTEQVCLHGN